jgi:ElaB/YqjD/DUF883 family membrane-anchored ribosome-binding protein
MAQAAAKSATNLSTDDLSQQVDTLKADISRLTETITAMGKQKAQSTKQDVELKALLLKERGKEALDSAGTEINRLSAEAERNVRERPMTALAIAAGIGLLVGLLTSRK